MSAGTRDFAARLAADRCDGWSIYWCAGVGVIGTEAIRLETETQNLRLFLHDLGAALDERRISVPGRIFLASSAGGVFGGNGDRPLTETSAPRPISDYGRAKLAQEDVLVSWARARPEVSTLVGRLSNLYGPGQRQEKPQGLISHMSRCLILAVPVHIFVPLDTFRDYLFVDDAAERVVAGMVRLEAESRAGARQVLKIFASERETALSSLIGVFRRVGRRQLRVVSGLSPIRAQQPVRLQFRSTLWADEAFRERTSLLDGVTEVHRHHLALFLAGRLIRPSGVFSR
jgi:UDP-glucose 4-epimerase